MLRVYQELLKATVLVFLSLSSFCLAENIGFHSWVHGHRKVFTAFRFKLGFGIGLRVVRRALGFRDLGFRV